MLCQRYDLTPDGRVYMDCYIQDWTPVKPFLPTRPAVLICPGGAYVMISQREGEPVALAFAARGFNAFVLNYSIGFYARYPNPLLDAATAMMHIRKNASKWHIDPNKIAIAGFSAGGHVAACLSTMAGREDVLAALDITDAALIRPNATILGYAVTTVDEHAMEGLLLYLAGDRKISEIEHDASSANFVDEHTPPAFVFGFYNDLLVPLEHSMIYCNALAAKDIPFELHLFAQGEHGCAMGDYAAAMGEAGLYDPSVALWMDLCVNWLENMFGKPDLGRKYESMLKSSATNRAHLGEGVLPRNVFEAMVTRKTPSKHFSLSTRVGDVLEDSDGYAVLKEYFPDIVSSPRVNELLELPVQALVLSLGGAMDQTRILSLAKALREATP